MEVSFALSHLQRNSGFCKRTLSENILAKAIEESNWIAFFLILFCGWPVGLLNGLGRLAPFVAACLICLFSFLCGLN